MKKINHFLVINISLVVIILLSAISFAANADSIMEFTEVGCSLIAGNTQTVYLTGESNNAVKWTSSDTGIVEIKSSNTRSASIRAVGEGNATVIAFDESGLKAEYQVQVKLQSIKLSKSDITLELGSYYSISFLEGYAGTWTSDNPDIASVMRGHNSQTGEYYAYGYGTGLGTTIIRASDNYGATASCRVTVVESYLELEKYSVSLKPKESTKIYAIDGNIEKVESTNTFLVQVKNWNNAVEITANSAVGSAQIVVTSKGGAQKTINVNVSKDFRIDTESITIDMDYERYVRFDYDYDEDEELVPIFAVRTIRNRSYYDRLITAYSEDKIEDDIIVTSLNPEIVEVNYYGEIIPVGVGTATIECRDPYGQKVTFTVNISESFISSYIRYVTYINKIKISSTQITGISAPGADVDAVIAGTHYKGKANSNGKFKIKVPLVSAKGVEFTFSYNGAIYNTFKETYRVKPKISIPKIYTTSNKLKVTVKNVIKGDKVKITIGKTIKTKKVKKNSKKASYTIRFKRQKAGATIKVLVLDKKNKKLNSKTAKVQNRKNGGSSSSNIVYWTPSGSVYHKSRGCPTLARSKTIRSGTIKQSGKKRCCKVCG